MPKGLPFDNDLLKLIFQATPISLIADNAASTPLTNLFFSLHTADPSGANNNQTTSEISYTGYARMPVARSSGGFTVTNNGVFPVANVSFPQSTGGVGGSVTFFAIGTTTTAGTGRVLYAGTVAPTISVSTNTTPILLGNGTSTGTSVTES